MLIDANRDYYPIGRVNEYWDWLIHQGEQGNIKIPIEIYEEFKLGKKDELSKWAKDKNTERSLRIDEEVDIDLVRQVTEQGYAADLTDIELEEIGRDPFLIAYALADPVNRIVVTTETPKSNKQRANRKVPNVCDQFGVKHINAFQLGHALVFRTDWK